MVFTARSQVEEVEICRLSGISCLSGSTEALCLLSRAGLSLLVLTCMVHSFRFDGPDPLHRIEPRWIVFFRVRCESAEIMALVVSHRCR
jgi:hypothetical protein